MAGMTIGELVAVIGIDDSGFRAGMGRVQRGVEQLSGRLGGIASGVERGASKIRQAMTGIAATALSVNPKIAAMVSTLTALGVGSTVVVAAAAGAALIGKAWSSASTSLKAFEEQAKKSLDALLALGKEAKNQQIANLRVQRVQAELSQGDLRQEQRRMLDRAGVTMPEGLNQRDRAQFNTLTAQIAVLDRTIENTTRGIKDLEEEARKDAGIKTLTERLEELGESVAKTINRLDLAEKFAADDAAFRRFQERKAFIATFPDTITTRTTKVPKIPLADGQFSGQLDTFVDKFKSSVEKFGGGVKEMVKRTFSGDGLANLGANLASNAIGFVAGKLIDGLSGLFDGVSEAQKRLAAAIERNTRALGATTDVLSERLKAAGLDDFATQAVEVVQGILNDVALGNLDPNGLDPRGGSGLLDFELLNRLGAFGFGGPEIAAKIDALIKALGFSDMALWDEQTFRDFFDQLDRAVEGLSGLGDELDKTTEALRNVPSGFKIAFPQFNATQGRVWDGDSMGTGDVVVNHYGDIRVDATGMSPEQLVPAIEREMGRLAARGRPSVLTRGTMRR